MNSDENNPTNPHARAFETAAELLTAPDSTFRFDGLDLMPTVVQDQGWKQLTAWFAEGKPTRAALAFAESDEPPRRVKIWITPPIASAP